MDLIIDGVRWVLWILVKGCMFLIDSVYNIVRPILTFDIGTNSTIWQWWSILMIFLFVFTLLRVLAMTLKAAIDEEYVMKLSALHTFYRILAITFIVAMTPIIIKQFTAFTSIQMDVVAKYFVVENNFAQSKPRTDDKEMQKKLDKLYKEYEGMPSQIFISSASNGKYPPYQLIDINATEGGMDHWLDGIPVLDGFFNITSALIGADGDYVYFPDTTMLIFLIVEGVCGAYMFLLMAIQISQRMISIGVKILISPYPISGIVNPDDRSFGLWAKLISADLISNVLQYIILLLVMAVTSSKAVQNFGIVGQGIFFLGGMLAVLIGPGQVAQIIGGDGMGLFMTMQGFQAMSALKGLTQAAGQKGIGMLGGAAALGTYGAGRAAGLNSFGNFPGNDNSASGGTGGIGPNGGSPSPNSSGPDGAGPVNPKAFSEPPTSKQTGLAKHYGMNTDGMSKGEVSLALQQAGAGKSTWSDWGNNTGGATGTIDKGNQTYGYENTPASAVHSEVAESSNTSLGNDFSSDVSSGNTSSGNVSMLDNYDESASLHSPSGNEEFMGNTDTQASSLSGTMDSTSGISTSGKSENETPRLSRENSLARRVGDSGSLGAKAVSKVGKAAYFSAGNRLMGQKSIVRGGRYITKNTKAQNLSNLHAGINDLMRPKYREESSNMNSGRRDFSEVKDINDIEDINNFNDFNEMEEFDK